MESFLQCHYLCMVQCVYGHMKKRNQKMHFGSYRISFNTDLKNYTAKIGVEPSFWCIVFIYY